MSKPLRRIKRDVAHIPYIKMSQTYCGKDLNEVDNLDYRNFAFRCCRKCQSMAKQIEYAEAMGALNRAANE
jgi:hypothetical protein